MDRRAFFGAFGIVLAAPAVALVTPEPVIPDGYSATLWTHMEYSYSYYTPRPNGVITSIEPPPVVYHGWD